MINEDRLERALAYLARTDETCAELKANVSRQEYLCKLARSKVFLTSEGTVEQRKALAETSAEVQSIEELRCQAIVKFERERSKRETEALIVDVWRSLNAARRQGIMQ